MPPAPGLFPLTADSPLHPRYQDTGLVTCNDNTVAKIWGALTLSQALS